MRPASVLSALEERRFPRVSGDAPWRANFPFTLDEFSPRERGCAPGLARRYLVG